LLGILAAWVAALCFIKMPEKRKIVSRLVSVSEKEGEVYDPAQDPEKIMKGDGAIETYFD
jgi:hypothetical protein